MLAMQWESERLEAQQSWEARVGRLAEEQRAAIATMQAQIDE